MFNVRLVLLQLSTSTSRFLDFARPPALAEGLHPHVAVIVPITGQHFVFERALARGRGGAPPYVCSTGAKVADARLRPVCVHKVQKTLHTIWGAVIPFYLGNWKRFECETILFGGHCRLKVGKKNSTFHVGFFQDKARGVYPD